MKYKQFKEKIRKKKVRLLKRNQAKIYMIY
jgi:hypothetical protein